jgi:magnesium transporter
MIKFYIHSPLAFSVLTFEEFITQFSLTPEIKDDLVWIDMLKPTPHELSEISRLFDIEFPSLREREEIELSSRYWEDDKSIMVNAYFFVSFFFAAQTKEPYNETVTFILQDRILVTVRYKELKSFDEINKRVLARPKDATSGYEIFTEIFDIRVDADADFLEYAAKEVNGLRKKLFTKTKLNSHEVLQKISSFQEFNLRIRETVFDKRRTITALLKSNKLPPHIKDELAIILKDINSLVEFTTINLNALDNLQGLFLAQINIEQNKIIKLFTVASVAMMPPTLVASLYGMNFKYMPELEWQGGYLWAIALMVISATIPLSYFRKKGWL